MSRLLGIDHGDRRIGLALSDPSHTIASPYKTLIVHNFSQTVKDLQKIIAEKEVEQIIVGLPLGLKGQETAQTKVVRQFVEKLEDMGYKIHLEDERLTSVSARRALITQQVKTGQNKGLIDRTAAALLLQQYIDKQSA